MAEGKKTFIFYSDWINMIKEMPDKDAGQLLKHILSYVNDENPETKNTLVKMAFAHMKPMLKADLKKWERIREKRSLAGSKGGKQKVANAKQMLQGAKQLVAVNDNVTTINSSSINNNHDYYLKECLNSHVWIENVCINTKLKKEQIPHALKDFNSHLIADGENKMNLRDYKSHFVRWVRKLKQQK